MQTLTDNQQRGLAIGLLFAVLLLLSAVIFIPWYNALNETLDNIDDWVFRIKRYERVIASRDEVLVKVEESRQKINALHYFYTQETPSLAAAELQQRIQFMVQRAEGEITSTQVLPQKDQEGLIRVAVKVRLSGDMDMLKALLYQIDIENPLISIDDITVLPVPGKRNRKTREMEASGKVTITLEVSSYMRNTV